MSAKINNEELDKTEKQRSVSQIQSSRKQSPAQTSRRSPSELRLANQGGDRKKGKPPQKSNIDMVSLPQINTTTTRNQSPEPDNSNSLIISAISPNNNAAVMKDLQNADLKSLIDKSGTNSPKEPIKKPNQKS